MTDATEEEQAAREAWMQHFVKHWVDQWSAEKAKDKFQSRLLEELEKKIGEYRINEKKAQNDMDYESVAYWSTLRVNYQVIQHLVKTLKP